MGGTIKIKRKTPQKEGGPENALAQINHVWQPNPLSLVLLLCHPKTFTREERKRLPRKKEAVFETEGSLKKKHPATGNCKGGKEIISSMRPGKLSPRQRKKPFDRGERRESSEEENALIRKQPDDI